MASTRVDIDNMAWTSGTAFYGGNAVYDGRDIIQLKVLSDRRREGGGIAWLARFSPPPGKLIKIVATALSDEHVFNLAGGRSTKSGEPARAAGGYTLNPAGQPHSALIAAESLSLVIYSGEPDRIEALDIVDLEPAGGKRPVTGDPSPVLAPARDPRAEAAITAGLAAYNAARSRPSDIATLDVLVCGDGSDEPVGGLLGHTSLGLFFLDLFYLPEGLRRAGLGSRIIGLTEEEARRRGCTAHSPSSAPPAAPPLALWCRRCRRCSRYHCSGSGRVGRPGPASS